MHSEHIDDFAYEYSNYGDEERKDYEIESHLVEELPSAHLHNDLVAFI